MREHPYATCQQIAFGKVLAFWYLFSQRKSVFVCSRSFYLLLNGKVFLIQYNCCIETRFSTCSSQEFAGFTADCRWLTQLFEYVYITFNVWREIFQFFSLGGSYQAKILQVIRGGFLYVKNSLHSCIYLSFPKNLCTEKENEKFSRQIILISIKAFKRYVVRF